MKLVITTVSVLAFTMNSCKKDGSTESANNADSVSAYDNSSMPTNNSSAMSTDSMNTASQNASLQNAIPTDSSKNSQGDSSRTEGR
jgi:hypothetical protein